MMASLVDGENVVPVPRQITQQFDYLSMDEVCRGCGERVV